MPTRAYAGDAEADDVAGTVGASASGLPGLGRVAVAAPKQLPHAAAAVSIGYGITEAQRIPAAESGGHQRAFGTLALMAQPLRFLAAALTFEGRHDTHPDDVLGASSSTVGEPRLIVRANEAVGRSFAVGAQLGVWAPGGEAPSLRLDATTLDALLLATYAPPGSDLALALNVGYRVDQSGQVLDARDRLRLRPGDRLSLRLSDSDAVLFGVGASKRLGPGPERSLTSRIEVLGELTWDVLVGKNAPKATESPLRLGLGGRYHVNEDDESFGALQLELRTELALSGRPSSGPTDALVPIDPRFAIMVGVRWAPAFGAKVKADRSAGAGAGGPAGDPITPLAISIRGRITAADGGAAIASARVTVTSDDPATPNERTAETGADGTFTVSELRPGRQHVVVKAAGFDDASADTTLALKSPPVVVDLVMKKAIKPGQLRGLVRSFSGKPLAATIRVEPLGVEAKTDADGTFQIDVPPGSYEVVVAATGHAGQRRPVQVEENGVTILNADLRPGKDAQ